MTRPDISALTLTHLSRNEELLNDLFEKGRYNKKLGPLRGKSSTPPLNSKYPTPVKHSVLRKT